MNTEMNEAWDEIGEDAQKNIIVDLKDTSFRLLFIASAVMMTFSVALIGITVAIILNRQIITRLDIAETQRATLANQQIIFQKLEYLQGTVDTLSTELLEFKDISGDPVNEDAQ